MNTKAKKSKVGPKFPLQVPTLQYEVVARFPHDVAAFTEGLEFYNGFLFESTGLYGSSTLRRVELMTGSIKDKLSINKNYFAEGLAILHGKIFQLTYKEGVCFVYDLNTMTKLKEFSYKGQGWGLTHDDRNLIMSNQTNQLYLIDPANFAQVGNPINVQSGGKPVNRLNELEYVDGLIYANVLPRSLIIRIDPKTGNVVDQIDLAPLRPRNSDVLNGIAHDEKSGHFFVTGKNWDSLFEISLTGKISFIN
jgi:glutamine cyclotransferase